MAKDADSLHPGSSSVALSKNILAVFNSDRRIAEETHRPEETEALWAKEQSKTGETPRLHVP
jgi:hypothetical protein